MLRSYGPHFISRHPRACGVFGVALLLVAGLLWPLPSAITHPADVRPVTVLDRSGSPLYESRHTEFGSTQFLSIENVPPQFLAALIAVEDRTFPSHMGISLRGIARAAWQNLRAGRIVSGGSTLTQQLVRLRMAPHRRTVLSKLHEMWLAVRLDFRWSKEKILEEYVNTVYFGHQAYGLKSAAGTYFGKNPAELSHAEIALLAGLIQSPVALDPYHDPAAALRRRTLVLHAMAHEGIVSRIAADTADREPLHLAANRIAITAPHFVFWVLGQLGDIPPGTTISTTLDTHLQQAVERIVTRRIQQLEDKNATSAAVVVLDADTGDILSMVGSADYFDTAHDGAVNVAVSARQPGSALKPFTYALALADGDTAATTVADLPLQLFTEAGNPYTPRNYDYNYHGLVRYREALANSYNIPAIKVLERVTVDRLQTFLQTLGIATLTREPAFYGLALTLGSGEVRLLELAQAYGMFARGGRTLRTRFTLDTPVEPGTRVLDERIAYIISDILSDTTARLPEFGEDSPLNLPPHRVAAKTGTTRNARDNWVFGYTEDYIVGVWVGNADNSPMKNTSGVTGAGPIFHDVMSIMLEGKSPRRFTKPAGLATVDICRISGKLPTATCTQTLPEYFLEGTQPTERDDMLRMIAVDPRNGLLAAGCPPEFSEPHVFTVFPNELQAWARENGYRQPPTTASPLCRHDAPILDTESGAVVITRPHHGDSYLLDPLVPDEHERIVLTARSPDGSPAIEWWIDDVRIGIGQSPEYRFAWSPAIGTHRIQARAGTQSDTITITVIAPHADAD